jgi:ATP-dependent DNA helicase RecG
VLPPARAEKAAQAASTSRLSSSQERFPVSPPWEVPIQFARGVGPKRALLFEKLGVRTLEDLLWHLPWRYEDRSRLAAIGELAPGMRATVCGEVTDLAVKRTMRRGLSIVEVTVSDASGSLQAVYFNQPYLEKVLRAGTKIMMSGTVVAGRRGWMDVRMEAPQYEVLGDEEDAPIHVGRIVPIYHETKGLTSRQIRSVVKGALDQSLSHVPEVLPEGVRLRNRLIPVRSAISEVHFPKNGTEPAVLERGVTPAHRRLAFEEFFVLQVALAIRHQGVTEEEKGIRFLSRPALLAKLQAALPFSLTSAQQSVLADIQRDMASSKPMHRLIQGDVGCGKTVVALHAMVTACGSGYQAALMVPTEILAEQHYLSLRGLLEQIGIRPVLLTGTGSSKPRKETLSLIQRGEAQVVIGTHALIQKGVAFSKLGLVVIDEQHKFGVLQRKTLLDKGYRPDVLVLTATPIPRTLAMTVYGDLDMSAITALPPGRKPIRTLRFPEGERRKAYRLVRDEVAAGRQAYVVFPLVEESEKLDLQAVMQAAERLGKEDLAGLRVGVLHGRMKSVEKDQTMGAFKRGEVQVLVASTVVEVGVDVANATVMVIEHADRFGLAQLHQLRGRVGRGADQSFCVLLSSSRTEQARQRLDAMVRTGDGFLIAEEDLKIRGPGEFFGTRQWGVPELKAGNLIRDAALLEVARKEAKSLVKADPCLKAPHLAALRDATWRRWKEKLSLGGVS